MKKIVLLFLLLILQQTSFATIYYMANSGNDSQTGTSSSTAWKTIGKLNIMLASMLPGDQILFNCGDTFEGEIHIPSGIGGNPGTPIVFDSYGSGNKPILSGSVSIPAWTLSAPNIWQASLTFNNVAQVFENHKRLLCARIPNTGYFRIGATNGNAGFTDATLSNTVNYWKGGALRWHLNEFWWGAADIDSSSTNGYLGFVYPSSAYNSLATGSGYFIENKFELLDTLNEWFFDKTNKILYLYSTTDPSTKNISASVYNIGLGTNWPWVNKYITVKNLAFREQAQDAMELRGSQNLVIQKCDIYNVGQYGILMSSDYASMTRFNDISDNHIENCISNGIYTFNVSQSQISKNIIKNSGLYPSAGGTSEAAGQCGMRLWFGDSLTITYNKIDSSGNCGIVLESSYSLIEKNIVEHSMLLLSDGAAIYNNTGGNNIYRNNILRYTEGNMEASALNPPRYTKELYFDASGEHNSIIENNTMVSGAKNAGIGLTPNTGNIKIRNNVVYKCFRGLEIYNYDPFGNPVNTLEVVNNTFYSNLPSAHPYYVNAWNGIASMYTKCDSNYLCNPFSNEIAEYANGPTTTYPNFTQWKSASAVDMNSTLSFFLWTYPTDSSFILTNELDSTVKFTFQNSVLDLDNQSLSSIILGPFSSKILIGSSPIIDSLVITGAISVVDKFNASLYPNPVNQMLTIQTEGPFSLNEKIELMDNTGRLMYSQTIQSKLTEVNISKFNDGVYFVKIGDNVKKIIVQH